MTRHSPFLLVTTLLAFVPLAVRAAETVPPRSASGQALAVPPAQLDRGDVYHITTGEDTQVLVTCQAPLQRTVLTCSRAVGYFVTPFDLDEDQPPLLAGAVRIPVASLTSGLAGADQLIQSPPLLNLAQSPEITFVLTGVRGEPLKKGDKNRRDGTLTATGELTVKDKTIPLELPVELSLVPFTWQTMGRTVGELLIFRTKFDLKLADLGLVAPAPPLVPRIAETARVDIYLLCTTMSPEKNLDPAVKTPHLLKQLQFLTLVRDFNDPAKGYEFGRQFLREIWDDAPALDLLATAVLTEDGIRTRDLGFVLTAARRANELTEFKDAGLLSTLARAYYERADLESAVKYARAAAEHLDKVPAPAADEVRATLTRYLAAAKQAEAAQSPRAKDDQP